MKKLILFFSIIPIFIFGQSNKHKFIEANVGVASVDSYEFDWVFPGASVLWGQTYSNKGFVSEWQIGLAAPSIVTGKLFIGSGNLDKNIGIGIRPWPVFIGPQAKLGRLTFSFEISPNAEISMETGLITTVGYRWKLKKKYKKEE
tara:strand:+ start:336 stop:770 length:435 start_codon:yes stop_codon:yes gene_type:complete